MRQRRKRIYGRFSFQSECGLEIHLTVEITEVSRIQAAGVGHDGKVLIKRHCSTFDSEWSGKDSVI